MNVDRVVQDLGKNAEAMQRHSPMPHRRPIFHIRGKARKTLCDRGVAGWKSIGKVRTSEAFQDENCCKICAAVLLRSATGIITMGWLGKVGRRAILRDGRVIGYAILGDGGRWEPFDLAGKKVTTVFFGNPRGVRDWVEANPTEWEMIE